MKDLEVPEEIAGRFTYMRRGASEVWLRKGFETSLLPDGERYVERLLPRLLSAARDVVFHRGRGLAVSFPLPGVDGRLVVRHYQHGGFFRYLTGDLFWSFPTRPFQELVASEEARGLGVATPEVIAAVVRWVTPVLYRGDLITREVPSARDLLEFFDEEEETWVRRRAIVALAEAIRKMHESQLFHSDLNVRNLLLSEGRGHIIDLDGAGFHEILGSRRIKANLMRLARSARKEKMNLSDREVLYFLYSYYGEDFRDTYSEEYSGEVLCQKHAEDEDEEL